MKKGYWFWESYRYCVQWLPKENNILRHESGIEDQQKGMEEEFICYAWFYVLWCFSPKSYVTGFYELGQPSIQR